MGDNVERAVELFRKGYNCSQAVFGAFCEDTGMNLEDGLKLSSSFGGGMGRLREVCGAVTGMFMVAGLKYGYADPKDKEAKIEHYKLIQELAAKFKEENGSIICRELLKLNIEDDSPIPETRTEKYYERRPCVDLVGRAAEIMEEMIKNKG